MVLVQQVSRLWLTAETMLWQGTLPYVSAKLVAENQARGTGGEGVYGTLAWPAWHPERVGILTDRS